MHPRASRLRLFLAASLVVGCGARTAPTRPPPPPDAGVAGGAGDCATGCDDGVFCNGLETCDEEADRCVPGEPPSCDDGDVCTADRCDPGTDRCVAVPTDVDGDGDGVGLCGGDCDDGDPTRSPRATEVCDFDDEDCDGRIDEGVRSPCDDCREGCDRVTVPGPGDVWDPDARGSSGVTVDGGGDLVLSRTRTETFFAWIANTRFGTLTKLDTRDGRQVAEYDSVLVDGSNGARPAGSICDQGGGSLTGNCPSRTAVDLRGAVYVANRAFGGQGTVTKIAGLEADCVDRNGNGSIDTSQDLDADGVIERSVPGEFLGQDDECLLWTVDVGGIGSVPRAVALDMSGNVWVGLHGGQAAVQLDPTTGEQLQEILMPRGPFERFRPYGAAGDSQNRIWFVAAATGQLTSIDASTGRVGPIETARRRSDDCSGSYGLAVDDDDRVWLAGFQCDVAFRYDPDTRRFFEVQLPDSGITRGIAAGADGTIYVATSHEGVTFLPSYRPEGPTVRLSVFDGDDGSDLRVYGLPGDPLPGLAAVGVGLASDGGVWLVNQQSGSATRFDPATETAESFPVGDDPYTYSDFTGFAFRTFTAPNGFARAVVEGCPFGPTEWERVSWDAEVPAGTRVEVRARSAATLDGLDDATFVGPFTDSPTELALPPGPLAPERFLEVEVSLFTDTEGVSPSIDDLTLRYFCPT
jgi:hypothetical protein